MGIWFALSKKIQHHALDIQKKQQKNKNIVSELRNQKAREENKWIFKKKDEVQRLAKAIQEAEEAGKKQNSEMNYMLNAMADNSDKLVKELEKIPYVYINGERSSFPNILGTEGK
jgi:seryl-tRNA synthetase